MKTKLLKKMSRRYDKCCLKKKRAEKEKGMQNIWKGQKKKKKKRNSEKIIQKEDFGTEKKGKKKEMERWEREESNLKNNANLFQGKLFEKSKLNAYWSCWIDVVCNWDASTIMLCENGSQSVWRAEASQNMQSKLQTAEPRHCCW